MRIGRVFAGSRNQAPLRLLAANGFGYRNITALPAGSEALQIEAHKLANQLFYNRSEGEPFYGYGTTGYVATGTFFGTGMNYRSFTWPLYVVPPGTPKVKVWFVKEKETEEVPHEPGDFENLQGELEQVPVPDPTRLVTSSQLASEGTDATVCIWSPSTDELYEFHRLKQFASGAKKGEWKSPAGVRIHPASTALGQAIKTPGGFVWSVSASGLLGSPLMITLQDVVEVLRGGKIKHALSVGVPVRLKPSETTFIPPAITNDSGVLGIPKEGETPTKEKVPNPAWAEKEPFPDAIKEGLWVRFPPSSRASEFFNHATEPLGWAMYEAIREYGLVVKDGAGNCTFDMEDIKVLGSPYSYAKVNPFAGATGAQTGPQLAETLAAVPASWTDSTLPIFKENLTGPESVFIKMPWRTLEAIEPRTE